MRRILLLCIGVPVLSLPLLWARTVAQAPAAVTPAVDIDRIFSKWTKSTPGCAVGASVRGTVTISNAYGMADLEQDVANRADTIFEAGSVAKQFTAAAVLLLKRDGKLSLDDPIRKYIAEVPDHDSPITIRQLLTHTSGLRDWGSVAGVSGWPRGTRVHTHAHVLEIVSHQQALNFAPGTHWSYSNTGYNLAAILVSRVSGMPFAEFTRTRIFEPLGMTRTSWRDDYTRIVKGRAIAYSSGAGGYASDMPFENVHGNGGLLTTVGDLLKWNDNFVTPRVGDAAFVSEQQEIGRFNSGREHNYSFGLRIAPYQGVREVSHGGATAGYRAFLTRFPDHGLSIAVLCNAGNADPTQHAHAIADTVLGSALRLDTAAASPIAEMQGPLSAMKHDDGYKPSPAVLSAFAGTYRSDEAETTLIVAIEEDQLIVRRRPDSRIVLRPRAPDAFDADETLGTIVFRRNASGQVRELSVVQDRVWDLQFVMQPPGRGSL
jgi:CubicO group peptidase (beta-lactamase class C family)